jgi:tRNA nucleotidyltransferase/poly(A) polymerase
VAQLQEVKQRIELNALETQIFDTLLAARAHHGLETTLRCAGGWVRDKLLGRESHDIDIAVNDMTGAEFGAKVAEYQKSQVCELCGCAFWPCTYTQYR